MQKSSRSQGIARRLKNAVTTLNRETIAMSENRKKVLDMLAAGKLTAQEAERLLDRLAALENTETEPEVQELQVRAHDGQETQRPRFLRVIVESSDGDEVNVRVPLALVRAGIRLGALMPTEAREQVESKGFDLNALSEMDTDELVDALAELEVNVESSGGDEVHVFCE